MPSPSLPSARKRKCGVDATNDVGAVAAFSRASAANDVVASVLKRSHERVDGFPRLILITKSKNQIVNLVVFHYSSLASAAIISFANPTP
ncbi:hypothetical protein EB231_34710 [Mesorhizobium sp. NZP2298]|nr:hypothetical protein EB231_34710 [Mesorhizobium sp. NZP2298]